jgi:hypothetical protein
MAHSAVHAYFAEVDSLLNLKNKMCAICFVDHKKCLHFYCFIISGPKESQ